VLNPSKSGSCRVENLERRALFSAAAGSLDLSFAGSGAVYADVAGDMDLGHAVAVQPDGKVLAAGLAEFPDGTRLGVIARFNPDGSPDVSFGAGGRLLMPASGPGVVEDITSLLVRGDGTIVAAGVARVGLTAFAAVRINADGTLDASFGNGGVALADFSSTFDNAKRVALDADGKVVVIGLANSQGVGDQGDFGVARFNADGSPDLSFSGDGKATVNFTYAADGGLDLVNAVAFGPGGTILLGGEVSNLSGPRGAQPEVGFGFARLTSDGSLDASFGDGGQLTNVNGGYVSDLLVNPDGTFFAAGGATGSLLLARYHADASPVTRFGAGGVTTVGLDGVTDLGGGRYRLHRLRSGRVAVAGAGTDAAFAGRFYAAGGGVVSTVSVSYATLGGFVQGQAAALTFDGKLVVAGINYPAAPYGPGYVPDTWHASANLFAARYRLGPGFACAVPDPNLGPMPLSGVMTGKPVVKRGRLYRFAVAYTCADGVDAAGLESLAVSGPNAFTGEAVSRRMEWWNHGTRLVIRYRLDAPGGRFDDSDNGTYAILAGQGVSLAGGPALGGFQVQSAVLAPITSSSSPAAARPACRGLA
jgi:uncharacterized delta-60 repeat protein